MNFFERYLSLWVALCMLVGVALGKCLPGLTAALRDMEFGSQSQINVPIAILIWLMIYPMMLKVDFASIVGVRKRPKGLIITCLVNWLVKPFSMALIGWIFFKHLFAYTLVQVSVNDLLMLVLFAPIVTLLVSGASALTVPFVVLLYAVACFIVIPLDAGAVIRFFLTRRLGTPWFEQSFLPRFHAIAVVALLATLVMIFAFQADNITDRFFHVVLIVVPILLQVHFNSSLVYAMMKLWRVPHNVAAPGALIGASNFFELAVATAIALYGPESGAALATVVGVLVEVPVMLSVCAVCNRTCGWFETGSHQECPVPVPGCCSNWQRFSSPRWTAGKRSCPKAHAPINRRCRPATSR